MTEKKSKLKQLREYFTLMATYFQLNHFLSVTMFKFYILPATVIVNVSKHLQYWPEHLVVLSFVLTFSLAFGLTAEKQALCDSG